MSEDVSGSKTGWNGSEGSVSGSINQSDRTKGNGSGSHQSGGLIDPVTGMNRLSLSSASPSVVFAATARQR